MKKALFLAVGAALASPAIAQSSVQLYGIVDLAYRHTTNEGTADSGSHKGSLTRMIGGGMSQSRLGINVTEDMGLRPEQGGRWPDPGRHGGAGCVLER